MHTINILKSDVINKIAAGEVIERPASVVKELVENAIDAKSTAITIEIKEGGKKLIRVTDNGIGIPKEEVKKAFIRHATSKIETEEDLNTLISLGFRGEALASIVAVSKTEMLTKVKEDLTGKRIVIEGGEIKCDEEVGVPNGTTVIINELFYNVPARKKFLKSDTTEATEINEIVNKLALAHPEISFKFINNTKVILHTTGTGKLINTIFNIYGKEITNGMLPVDREIGDIKIDGFIGKVDIQRGTRIYETFFVNGRYVKSKVLSEAVEEAYYGYIMNGKFPFCMLNIYIEPELIDINVHPAKTEIKFNDEKQVYEIVLNVIREKLQSIDNSIDVNLNTESENNKIKREEKKEQFKEIQNAKEASLVENTNNELNDVKNNYNTKSAGTSSIFDKLYGNRKTIEEVLSKNNISNNVNNTVDNDFKDINDITSQALDPLSIIDEVFKEAKDEGIIDNTNVAIQEEIKIDEKLENERLNTMPIRDYKIIGQLFNTYFLVEQKDEFYMIDQHAAQEKVFYEQLKEMYENKNINSQVLLESIMIDLTPKEVETVEKCKEIFERFGFSIENFGGNTYKITEVPYIFETVVSQEMFHEMLDDLLDKKFEKDTKAFDLMFATIACKRAIKANDKQSIVEGEKLIEKLMELENPFNCPHGRPVIIRLTKSEIERKFKRII